MALTRNALIASTAVTPGATTVTGSVTNTTNALLLLAVAGGGTSGTPSSGVASVTGLGLTWTQVTSVSTFAGGNNISVWWAQGPSSTGAITITWGANHTNAIYQLDEFPGADTLTPIVQSGVINGVGGSGTAPSVTLGATPRSTSATYCVLDSTDTTAVITAGSGFTLLGAGTTTIAAPNQHLAVEWNNNGAPPALCPFARDVSFAGILIALEIAPPPPGQPSFRSFATASGTASTAVVSTPAGFAAGDLLVLFVEDIASNSGSTVLTPPPGFTYQNSISTDWDSNFYDTMTVFTKVADGTEGSTLSSTFSVSLPQSWVVYCLAFQHVGIAVAATGAANDGGGPGPYGTSLTLPSITMPAAGGLIALCAVRPSSAPGPSLPAGMTSITSTAATLVAYEVQGPGATGTRVTTFGDSEAVGLLLGLAPTPIYPHPVMRQLEAVLRASRY